MTKLCNVTTAIDELQKGKMLILLDRTREKEGDFFIPAQNITPQHISVMTRYGGGLVCTAITRDQANRLLLPLMVAPVDNTERTKVNFTVTVSAARGITTGVSAYDRAKTIRILADPYSAPPDLVRPGHVLGLVAQDGGVIKRNGHTEAAVDLSRLVGFTPAGVLCEIIDPKGKMATLPYLLKLGSNLDISILPLDYLIDYLTKHPLPQMQSGGVVKTAVSQLPTAYGTFRVTVYTTLADRREHAALLLESRRSAKEPIPVRIHSQCLTGDTLFSLKCDCGGQLQASMEFISKHGSGLIIYLNQEGRGIGLTNKIKAYALQEKGMDTVEANETLGLPADVRDYEIAVEILRDLGVSQIALLTNNPDKIEQLQEANIRIVRRIPVEITPTAINKPYLSTKKKKLKHLFTSV